MTSNHRIRAVIWDMGGVILRTEDPAPRLRLAQRLGIARADLERIVFESESAQLAQRGLITAEAHWLNLARQLNLPPEELEAFERAFWSGDRVDQKLVQYIRSLRPRHQTALLSNAWSSTRRLLGSYPEPFLDVFDEVIFSAEVKLAKPDPEIYHLMLNRLGVPAHQAVFVDDFVENVEGARAAGLHAILFKSASQTVDALKPLLES